MGQFEYRIEYVQADTDRDAGPINVQLVERLNGWARDGWRVVNVDLNPRPQFGPRSRPVLLERDYTIDQPGRRTGSSEQVGASGH
jgi:hypothetical protein